MTRTELINQVAAAINAKSYLEIGLGDRVNFKGVNVSHKEGCDIKGVCTHRMPSKALWAMLPATAQGQYLYDLIFVDGDHHYEPAFQDLLGALKVGRVVIAHDVYPETATLAAAKHLEMGAWCGEVYRAFAQILGMQGVNGCAIPDDHGVGVLWHDTTSSAWAVPGISYTELRADPERYIKLTTGRGMINRVRCEVMGERL